MRDTAESRRPKLAEPARKIYCPALPMLTARQVKEALQRLKAGEEEEALRERVFPFAHEPGLLHYATDASSHWAHTARVSALVPRLDLLWALQSVFGKHLQACAIHLLENLNASASARRVLTMPQAVGLSALGLAATGALMLAPALAIRAIELVFTCGFLCVIMLRIFAFTTQSHGRKPATRAADADLPVYSILVPMFRETRVLRQILRALTALDYPPEKLDIKLVIEECDVDMRRACAWLRLPDFVEVIVVPAGGPQTKPKALNYALQFSRGSLVCVFDAEDIPDRDQLRKAAGVFLLSPPSLACLQAQLHFFNANQNWLTRQFATEYAVQFTCLVPGLAEACLPLPLGGTSNHFRTETLRECGGWDPWNVTEDADLGVRLARSGYQVEALDSRTHEEAMNHFRGWFGQRTRWQKGWMQTWLVHMRNPVKLWQDLGFVGFVLVQAIFLGFGLSALLHPVFLGLLLAGMVQGTAFTGPAGGGSAIFNSIALVTLATGYGVGMGLGLRGLARAGLSPLCWSVLAMPVYWLMISAAAWVGLWELVTNPHRWNKSEHGFRLFTSGKAYEHRLEV